MMDTARIAEVLEFLSEQRFEPNPIVFDLPGDFRLRIQVEPMPVSMELYVDPDGRDLSDFTHGDQTESPIPANRRQINPEPSPELVYESITPRPIQSLVVMVQDSLGSALTRHRSRKIHRAGELAKAFELETSPITSAIGWKNSLN